MEEGKVLSKIYQEEYTVYQRDSMYCFLKGKTKQENLSLAESYSLGGQYLFCPDAVCTPEVFCANAISYLKRWNRHLLFLWVENPEEPFPYWKINKLETHGRGQQLFFDSYRLVLNRGFKIDIRKENFLIGFEQEGSFWFGTGSARLTGTGKEIRLVTSGAGCGALEAALLAEESNTGKGLMEGLDAGIYCSRIMEETEEDAGAHGYVLHSVSRVLIPDGKVTVEMKLSPQALLNTERTRLQLAGNRFGTHFSTQTGKQINVTAAEDAALVFQQKPVMCYKDQEDKLQTRKRLYLGMDGCFSVEGGSVKILCGLSGTETIQTGEHSCLKFTPFMPGVFPGSGEDTDLGSMSWTGVTGGSVYACQPEDAALYVPSESSELRFLEIPAARFAKEMPPVPMLPFREVGMDAPDELPRLEEKLYRIRRNKLAEGDMSAMLFEGQNIRAATPQGLLAEITPEGAYQWVGFADLSGSGIPDMRLTHVGKALENKLMQKDFLYAAVAPEELDEWQPSEGFDMNLEGIHFRLLPKDWRIQDKKTLIIFKYSCKKSIKEAIKNAVLEETAANAYNSDHELKDGYEDFIRVYEDAAFEGILAVNVPVAIEELPAEVKILMRSVEPENFYASFLLIEAGQISYHAESGLQLSRSRISGVVDYLSDRKLSYESTPPNFDYLTREINIRIREGHIESFTSSSEVLINRLFEASAEASDNPDGNCLVLDGKLVKDGEVPKYQYALRQCVCFDLKSSGIETVWVREMDLTVGKNGEGMFSLSGILACKKMEQADLLGFGGDEPQQGLSFSRLLLRMPEKGAMSMEYGLLVYDRNAICLRQDSFPSLFAASLVSIIIERAGESPEKKGFTSISAPLSQGTPGQCYQAILFQISIGSLGELSEEKGIQIELLIAFWEAEDKSVQYYAGIRLPGIFSENGLKLQGLFRIGFSSISLEKQESGYVIKLHNFGVTVLGDSFPGESSDIFLFSDGKNVGWYAAYAGGEDTCI